MESKLTSEWTSGMNMPRSTKLRSLLFGMILCLAIGLSTFTGSIAKADPCNDDQDCYVPDSVYYLPFSFRPLSCGDSIEARLPVYLWSDAYSMAYYCHFAIERGARFDTGYVYFLGPCETSGEGAYISSAKDSCDIGVNCWQGALTPAYGKIFELVLRCARADTVSIAVSGPYGLTMGYPISWWSPRYQKLDTTFVVPTEFPSMPGDVNCSQNVSISDAVFLIKYIFAGGCAPCNPNAADVNHSCTVSISDAVSLINYIFAGGSPPVAGCVVR